MTGNTETRLSLTEMIDRTKDSARVKKKMVEAMACQLQNHPRKSITDTMETARSKHLELTIRHRNSFADIAGRTKRTMGTALAKIKKMYSGNRRVKKLCTSQVTGIIAAILALVLIVAVIYTSI